MKRFLYKISLFFASIIVIDLSVGLFGDYLQVHASGGVTKGFNDLVINDKHEILILGSSRAHAHYDTPFLSDTLGLDVYNAGYDGNGIILSYGILEMIIERYNPILVIYDVEPSFDINVYKPDNNNSRYLHYLKPYFRHEGVSEIIKDVSYSEWIKVHSGMVRYNTIILSKLLDFFRVDSFCKGYKPLKGVYSPTLSEKVNTINVPPQTDNLKIDYIKKLILLTQNKQIPLCFVASPRYRALSSSVFQPIMQICLENDIPFYDYSTNELFVNNNKIFNDPMHLNYKGAREFSKNLVYRINEIIKKN